MVREEAIVENKGNAAHQQSLPSSLRSQNLQALCGCSKFFYAVEDKFIQLQQFDQITKL